MNTNSSRSALVRQSLETDRQQLHDEVLSGLSGTPRTLPSKLLFDERGSMLFDCLCTLPEFYPARAEMEILESHAEEITGALGFDPIPIRREIRHSQCTVTFLGCREKQIPHLPLKEYLWHTKGWSKATTPQRLRIVSDQSSVSKEVPRRILYLPWCMVGSLPPEGIEQTLRVAGELCGSNGRILLGLDLTRDARVLEQAYNDRLGIAAAFNLNVLERLNRELEADFNLRWFQHRAFYDSAQGGTEMQLVSLREQKVCLDGLSISLREYETIQTARYYLHALPDFARLAEAAGLHIEHVWMDDRESFSVQYLEPILPGRSTIHKSH